LEQNSKRLIKQKIKGLIFNYLKKVNNAIKKVVIDFSGIRLTKNNYPFKGGTINKPLSPADQEIRPQSKTIFTKLRAYN
jgi:hypothetical protein